MSEQEQEPTGEMIDGTLFVDGGLSASADEAEVIPGPVFIPAAWREQLGLGQDDLCQPGIIPTGQAPATRASSRMRG